MVSGEAESHVSILPESCEHLQFPVSFFLQSGTLVCGLMLHILRMGLGTSVNLIQMTIRRETQRLVSRVIHYVKFQD